MVFGVATSVDSKLVPRGEFNSIIEAINDRNTVSTYKRRRPADLHLIVNVTGIESLSISRIGRKHTESSSTRENRLTGICQPSYEI